MANLFKLKKIVDLLVTAGHGNDDVCAEHDTIYVSPPDEIDPESELGLALAEAGAKYDDSDGWTVSA